MSNSSKGFNGELELVAVTFATKIDRPNGGEAKCDYFIPVSREDIIGVIGDMNKATEGNTM